MKINDREVPKKLKIEALIFMIYFDIIIIAFCIWIIISIEPPNINATDRLVDIHYRLARAFFTRLPVPIVLLAFWFFYLRKKIIIPFLDKKFKKKTH